MGGQLPPRFCQIIKTYINQRGQIVPPHTYYYKPTQLVPPYILVLAHPAFGSFLHPCKLVNTSLAIFRDVFVPKGLTLYQVFLVIVIAILAMFTF